MNLEKLTTILVMVGLISCNKTTKEPTIHSPIPEIEVIERFVADNIAAEVDTTVQSLGIQIMIAGQTSGTYVANEYTIDGVKHIDKYRDIEWKVRIMKDNKRLIDTVLSKDSFEAYLGHDFLAISNFHGYWMRGTEGDTIEFFGVISRPETDWSFAFSHFVDVNTKAFLIREHIDEEIN